MAEDKDKINGQFNYRKGESAKGGDLDEVGLRLGYSDSRKCQQGGILSKYPRYLFRVPSCSSYSLTVSVLPSPKEIEYVGMPLTKYLGRIEPPEEFKNSL